MWGAAFCDEWRVDPLNLSPLDSELHENGCDEIVPRVGALFGSGLAQGFGFLRRALQIADDGEKTSVNREAIPPSLALKVIWGSMFAVATPICAVA